jgi:hypothetical protein
MAIWPQVCSRIVRCLMPATHIAVLSKLPQREKPTTTVIGRTTSLARYSPPFSLIARRTLDKNCLA